MDRITPPGYTIKELMEFMGHADLQMVKPLRQAPPGQAKTTQPIASTRIFEGLRLHISRAALRSLTPNAFQMTAPTFEPEQIIAALDAAGVLY